MSLQQSQQGLLFAKTDKAELAKGLKKSVQPSALPTYILDRGALIQSYMGKERNIPRNNMYTICEKQYVSSVRIKYGNCCIIFDGYTQASTKDQRGEPRKLAAPD